LNDLEIDKWVCYLGKLVEQELVFKSEIEKGSDLSAAFKISESAKILIEQVEAATTRSKELLSIDEKLINELANLKLSRERFEALYGELKPRIKRGPDKIDFGFAFSLIYFITKNRRNKKRMDFLKNCLLQTNSVFQELRVTEISRIPEIQNDTTNPSFWYGKLKDQLFKILLSNPNKTGLNKFSEEDKKMKKSIEGKILEGEDLNNIMKEIVKYQFSN